MAKLLQETVKESGLKADSVVRSDEFKEFFRKVGLPIPYRSSVDADGHRSGRLGRRPRRPTSFGWPSSSTTTSPSTTFPAHSSSR